MAALARATAIIAGLAAEDLASVVQASVVTAKATTAIPFVGIIDVLFDPHRSWCRAIVATGDRVAGVAIVFYIINVGLVCEERAVSPADIFGRERRSAGHLFRVANHAVGFQFGLLVAAGWRVAGVAFRVGRDCQDRRFRRLLMATIAIEFLPVGKKIGDM